MPVNIYVGIANYGLLKQKLWLSFDMFPPHCCNYWGKLFKGDYLVLNSVKPAVYKNCFSMIIFFSTSDFTSWQIIPWPLLQSESKVSPEWIVRAVASLTISFKCTLSMYPTGCLLGMAFRIIWMIFPVFPVVLLLVVLSWESSIQALYIDGAMYRQWLLWCWVFSDGSCDSVHPFFGGNQESSNEVGKGLKERRNKALCLRKIMNL